MYFSTTAVRRGWVGVWSLVGLMTGGCVQFDVSDGEYALQFESEAACGSTDLSGTEFPAAFTAEAWVRAKGAVAYQDYPLLSWPGAFTLWESAEGGAYFTDGTDAENGAYFPDGWMDGELHHIAGTYADGVTTLYIDGVRLADHRTAVLGSEPGSILSLGCSTSHDGHHQGLIDEVRLSSVARYDDDFELPAGEFVPDDNTLRLWHFNEGEGTIGLDAMRQSDMTLSDVDWAEFILPTDSEFTGEE